MQIIIFLLVISVGVKNILKACFTMTVVFSGCVYCLLVMGLSERNVWRYCDYLGWGFCFQWCIVVA